MLLRFVASRVPKRGRPRCHMRLGTPTHNAQVKRVSMQKMYSLCDT